MDSKKKGASIEMSEGKTKYDIVQKPKHYNMGKIEVIDVIEDWDLNFHEGNAVKYIGRAKHKGNYEKDIRKAIWYLQRLLMNIVS